MTITIRDGTVSRALNLRFIGREFKCCLGTIVQGLRKVQSGPEKNCTKFNALSFCNPLQQNRAVFTKMLRKDHCLPVNAKSVLVG